MQNASQKVGVLAVDDREGMLLAVEAALSGLDIDLVLARSGREALRAVLRRDFAVILLDIHMPGLDGFETAELIRQRRSSARTPIIFMTADSSEPNVERSYSLGAVDYLSVPVIPSVLRTKVSVFVDLHNKTEQVRRQAESLRARTLQLQKLTAASMEINAAATLPAVLSACARAARDIVGTHQAYVHVQAEAPGEYLGAAAFSDRYGHLGPRALQPERTGLFELTLARRSPVRMSEPELTALAAWQAPDPSTGRPARRGYLGVPLGGGDAAPLGVLELTERLDGDFTEDDTTVAVQLAQLTAIAIQNLMNLEAREANRLKDEFLAVVSHELRTPLSAILGWVHVLRVDPGAPQARRALDIIERNARLQVRLIDDLMDVSRLLHGRLELQPMIVSLRAIAEQSVQTLRPAAQSRGLKLTFDTDGDEHAVVGDPERLEQVVTNLVTNAIKFTPQGGAVGVELRTRGGRVELRVTDTGEGLPADLLPVVFDRFRQGGGGVGRRRGGLGLGLTIVRHIVEAHGGTIEARSPGPGLGATFVVELPLAEHAAHHARPAPAALPGSAKAVDLQGLRILVVEDDDDTRSLLEHMLSSRGAEVEAHASAEEAVEAIDGTGGRVPDVIVSDLGLPGMDGVEFMRHVQAMPRFAERGMPALALTASGSDEDGRRALAAGFRHCARKPIEPEVLVELIARLQAAS